MMTIIFLILTAEPEQHRYMLQGSRPPISLPKSSSALAEIRRVRSEAAVRLGHRVGEKVGRKLSSVLEEEDTVISDEDLQ